MRLESLLQIIHEDAELLAINKPAGLVCHPSKDGPMSSLIGRVRLYLGEGSRPHLVNRLDRETSGVTIVARTDSAALELRRLWEGREVEKEYLAIVHGRVEAERGVIDAPLGKDESSRVAIKDCVRADGLASQTQFFLERTFSRSLGPRLDRDRPRHQGEGELSGDGPPSSERGCSPVALPLPLGAGPAAAGQILPSSLENTGSFSIRRAAAGAPSPGTQPRSVCQAFSLLRVLPRTGRKHQIRIHLAHIGHPIVGDKIYGGDEDLYLALVEGRLNDEQKRRLILPHQALHARAVRFNWRDQRVEFSCAPEEWFWEFIGRDDTH